MLVKKGICALDNFRKRRCLRGMSSCLGRGVARYAGDRKCEGRDTSAEGILLTLGVTSSCFGTGGRKSSLRDSVRLGSGRVCSLGRRLVSTRVGLRGTRGRLTGVGRRGGSLRVRVIGLRARVGGQEEWVEGTIALTTFFVCTGGRPGSMLTRSLTAITVA